MKIRCIVPGLFGICSGFPIYIGPFKTSRKEERDVYPPQQEGNFEGIGEDSVKSRTILPFLLPLSNSAIK